MTIMLAIAIRRFVVFLLVAIWVGGAYSWHVENKAAGSGQIPEARSQNIPNGGPAGEGGGFIVQEITLLTVQSMVIVGARPKVTAAPIMKRKLDGTERNAIRDGIQVQKRADETCPKDYQLCAQSLGGGCCPNDRVCGENSCLPAAASTAMACGRQNYFACALEFGGGCCPNNYQCGRNGCTPLPAAISTLTCGPNSYLCPAALNYGCCRIGLGCGVENCYSTGVSSFTFTQIITTTDANSLQRTFTTTITSTTTPFVPEETATRGITAGIVPKVSSTPSAIPKTQSSTSKDGGLTKAQLGGIIGGAVGLLLILLIATFIIVRRLNKAIKLSTDSNARSKSSNGAGPKPRPNGLDIDAMSVDPLMIAPSEILGTPRFSSNQSTPFEADSSPVARSPFSPRDSPHTSYQRGYNVVSTSDASSGNHNRHESIDSNPSMRHSQASYFDIPHDPRRSSQPQYHHARQWSNASDQSASSQDMAELDAGSDGDRRSSFQRALQGMGKMVPGRKRNETSKQLEGKSSDASGSAMDGNRISPGHTLGFIPEAGESRLQVGTLAKLTGTTPQPQAAFVVDHGSGEMQHHQDQQQQQQFNGRTQNPEMRGSWALGRREEYG